MQGDGIDRDEVGSLGPLVFKGSIETASGGYILFWVDFNPLVFKPDMQVQPNPIYLDP